MFFKNVTMQADKQRDFLNFPPTCSSPIRGILMERSVQMGNYDFRHESKVINSLQMKHFKKNIKFHSNVALQAGKSEQNYVQTSCLQKEHAFTC